MLKYIAVRIMWVVLIFFTFMSIFYIIVRLIVIYDYSFLYEHLSFIEKITPIVKDYFAWLIRVITKWDWGLSTKIKLNTPVFDLITPRLPVTIKVNLIAYLLYVPIGLILGTISALNKNKFFDNFFSIMIMVMSSLPSFVFIFLLMLVFGYYLNWFPTQFPPKISNGWFHIKALILPVIAISVEPIANFSRLFRGELTESTLSEYMLLAKTKGLSTKQAIFRHGFRVSLVPVVPTIIFSFVSILAGSFIIEIIYSIPGMGNLYYEAIINRDYNLIMAITSIYTIIMLVASIIVDLSYALIDP